MPSRLLRTALLGAVASTLAVTPAHARKITPPPVTPAGEVSWIAGGAPVNDGSDPLRIFEPSYMDRSPSVTLDQALTQARRFDVIWATAKTYTPYVAQMKAANPNLRLIVYMNGALADTPTSFPEDWYGHDAAGHKVTTAVWNLYVMDPTNPGWVQSRIDVCKKLLDKTGYDGCGLDNMSTAITGSGYVSAAVINPHTGLPWTGDQYLKATAAIVTAVRSATGKPVYANGVSNGPKYFDVTGPTSQELAAADGAMSEGFLRNGRDAITAGPRTEAQWKANVDMLVDAEAKNAQILAITKVWGGGTDDQKNAWHRFALSSFLLGASGHSRFSFTYSDPGDQRAWNAYWDTHLGAPTGAYVRDAAGFYSRPFEHGVVVVNPQAWTVHVTLPQPMQGLTGAPVTSLDLPAHSGDVYVPAGS